jgi:hypothetical protein
MGYPILKVADFTGFYNISQNRFVKTDIETFISMYEGQYLDNLLGCELSSLLIADLDVLTNIPVTARFLDLWNPFCEDTYRCNQLYYRSTGIKDMLRAFVYYHYVNGQQQGNTIAGNVNQQVETAKQVSGNDNQFNVILRYNEGVKTFNVLQQRLILNSALYPEFKGQYNNKELMFFV